MVYKNDILLKDVQYYQWKSNNFESMIKIVIKR